MARGARDPEVAALTSEIRGLFTLARDLSDQINTTVDVLEEFVRTPHLERRPFAEPLTEDQHRA